MSADIQTPQERECVRCGREEAWDESVENWVVVGDAVGNRYCIHDWDITGKFAPVEP